MAFAHGKLRGISRSARGAGAFGVAVGLGIRLCPGTAHAHEVREPVPHSQAPAAWPHGRPEAHDVVVPVVLTVTEEGKVASVTVEASVDPAFDRAAIACAERWTFEPARRDDRPVAARIRSVVRFVAGPEVLAPTPPTPAPIAPEEAPRTVRVSAGPPPRSASAVVLPREVVTAAPHKTASDALAVVPGVFVTQHSGEGKAHQIFLRGFDAVHGQDLELWVGGVPVNEVSNVHGQGYADLNFVMPEVIRDITSTPGTFDPRQGDFAVAGTVRMRLAYPEPGATVKGTVGSFGTKRLFLAYHPKDTSEETFAAFESYDTDGFGPNRAARRGSFIAQGTHDFANGLSLRVMGSTYSGRFDSAGVVPAASIDTGAIDRFAVLDPRQGGYSVRHQLLTELHVDGEDVRWSVAPFIVFRNLHLRQNFTGYFLDTQRGGAPNPGSDNTQQLNESVTAGMTASFTKALRWLSARDKLEAGVYGRYDVIEQSQRRLSEVNDAPTATLVDANVKATDIAGYVDLSLSPWSRLVMRGGVRADVLSYATRDRVLASGQSEPGQGRAAQGAHLGKKLTADLAALPRLRVLASYGEGFRSPQARSLSEGEKTFFTEVRSYELGARWNEGSAVSASLAGFYTQLSEDLVFDPATARNEKVPGTDRRGLSADVLLRAGTSFVLSSSATWTDARFRESDATYGEGDRLPYVPQLVVRSDVAWRKHVATIWKRPLTVRAGAGLEGIAGRPLPYGEAGQNIFLVDTSIGVRLQEVELGLDVFNLLDADWYDGQFVYASNFSRAASPSRVPASHVSVGAPRTFWASLTLFL